MPRRSKEELILAIKEMYVCFDVMCDCINLHGPADVNFDKTELVSLQQYLDGIEKKAVTASEVLSAINEAVNEHGLFMLELTDDDSACASAVLQAYSLETGRSFWEDVRNPKLAIKELLKRGEIQTHEDYYLLKEAVIDMSNKLMSDKSRIRAEKLLNDYEFRQ